MGYAGAARRRVHLATVLLYYCTSACVWSSPRQMPGLPCQYPSDRTPPDATIEHAGVRFGMVQLLGSLHSTIGWVGFSAGAAPHARSGAVDAPDDGRVCEKLMALATRICLEAICGQYSRAVPSRGMGPMPNFVNL